MQFILPIQCLDFLESLMMIIVPKMCVCVCVCVVCSVCICQCSTKNSNPQSNLICECIKGKVKLYVPIQCLDFLESLMMIIGPKICDDGYAPLIYPPPLLLKTYT